MHQQYSCRLPDPFILPHVLTVKSMWAECEVQQIGSDMLLLHQPICILQLPIV